MVVDRSPSARRFAVTTAFSLVGGVAGAWAARIPAIKAQLHLSAGILGLALLGPAVGAVIAMALLRPVLAKVQPRRIVGVMFVPLGLLLYVLSLVDSSWQLFATLFGWGAAIGTVDVAMNIEGATLQDFVGRRIMSRFHAAYSLGGLAGAGSGALAAAARMSVKLNFAIVGLVVLACGVAASTAFSRARIVSATESIVRSKLRPKRSWPLFGLATIALGCFLAEGAVNDWSAVYLHSSLRAGAGLAAVAYTAFSCAMVAGRLIGDHLAERVGPVRLVRTSCATAAIGLAIALVAGQVDVALAGFVLLGLGLSFVVPLVFTAASQLEPTGPSLATVNSFGYVGLLVGPPLIGGLADAIGLPTALGVIVLICVATAILANAVAPKRPFEGSTAL